MQPNASPWSGVLLAQAESPTPDANTLDTEAAVQSITTTLITIAHDFLEHLPLIGAGIGVLLVTWGVSAIFRRLSSRLLERTGLRASLRELVERLLHITIWVLGLLIAGMVVFPGLTPTRALAGLGLSSIAIGFAFKDIFENFFAGILILWRFPFESGDFVECDGILGKIEEVTVRNTLLRKVTGELVVVPNATIFKNAVDVLTNWDHRRITVICGVSYDTDVDEARDVIAAAVETCDTVVKDRPVEIFAREFGASSVDFEITWWASSTPREVRVSRDQVVSVVKRALDDAGIEIPFPYRTLTFKEPLALSRGEEHSTPEEAHSS